MLYLGFRASRITATDTFKVTVLAAARSSRMSGGPAKIETHPSMAERPNVGLTSELL